MKESVEGNYERVGNLETLKAIATGGLTRKEKSTENTSAEKCNGCAQLV